MLSTRQEVREEAQKQILELLSEHHDSPTRVARLLHVNKGLVSRVRDGGYSEFVVLSLGLPIIKTAEVEICLECGRLHPQKKTCASILKKSYRRRRRKAADLDPSPYGELQSQALDDIAAENGCETWTEYCQKLADSRIESNGE